MICRDRSSLGLPVQALKVSAWTERESQSGLVALLVSSDPLTCRTGYQRRRVCVGGLLITIICGNQEIGLCQPGPNRFDTGPEQAGRNSKVNDVSTEEVVALTGCIISSSRLSSQRLAILQ